MDNCPGLIFNDVWIRCFALQPLAGFSLSLAPIFLAWSSGESSASSWISVTAQEVKIFLPPPFPSVLGHIIPLHIPNHFILLPRSCFILFSAQWRYCPLLFFLLFCKCSKCYALPSPVVVSQIFAKWPWALTYLHFARRWTEATPSINPLPHGSR